MKNKEDRDCWTCIHHCVCCSFAEERAKLFTGEHTIFDDISNTWEKYNCNSYIPEKPVKSYTLDDFKRLLIDEINYTNDTDILFTIYHFVNLIHELKDGKHEK